MQAKTLFQRNLKTSAAELAYVLQYNYHTTIKAASRNMHKMCQGNQGECHVTNVDIYVFIADKAQQYSSLTNH